MTTTQLTPWSEDDFDLSDSLIAQLRETVTILNSTLSSALRPFGLNQTEYVCLDVLGQQPGLSSSELARTISLSHASTNKAVQVLVEKRLIDRAAAASTGLPMPLRLTDQGEERRREAALEVARVESTLRRRIGPASATQVRSVLERCVAELRISARRDHNPTEPFKRTRDQRRTSS